MNLSSTESNCWHGDKLLFVQAVRSLLLMIPTYVFSAVVVAQSLEDSDSTKKGELNKK